MEENNEISEDDRSSLPLYYDSYSEHSTTPYKECENITINGYLINDNGENTTTNTDGFTIWGTNIPLNQCKFKFKEFIKDFVNFLHDKNDCMAGIEEELPFYLQHLKKIEVTKGSYLYLNCDHLKSFDPELYYQLKAYPSEVIPMLDIAINELFLQLYPNNLLTYQIQIRPFNSQVTDNIEMLNPENLDQLITVSGIIIKMGDILPEISDVFFRCVRCYNSNIVKVERGYINEPIVCTNCMSYRLYNILHNRSTFSDKQIIKLQELTDNVKAGQQPASIYIISHDKLFDNVQIGEYLTVTGVYRGISKQKNMHTTHVYSILTTYIDVLHFEKFEDKYPYTSNIESICMFSPTRIEVLQTLSLRDDIFEYLACSVAPTICGNMDIKKAILLLLVGGTKKCSINTGRGKIRSEINILLCGDPGIGKSQFLSYVNNLMPYNQYVSGKGTSAAGLGASVIKNPSNNQFVLQSGALIHARDGICCIDEFDKMDQSSRSILHEVMEQQTLSIAKAGIICQLNVCTSIMAAANPCESTWNHKKTILENIKLPSSLLSRFDLIFVMVDPDDETKDVKIARHLVTLYQKTNVNCNKHLTTDIIMDYVAYSKQYINPKISNAASEKLIQLYIVMRKVGKVYGNIGAYPRQLESLIRLAEAHAKIRFSNSVEICDVDEVYRLYMAALKSVGTDFRHGLINFDILGEY